MWKKFAVVGSVVAVTGLGVGGVATTFSATPAAQAASLAAVGAAPTTSTDPTTGKPATKAGKNGAKNKHAGLAGRLSRTSHATWTTKDKKTGTFVTHDAVRGAVTTVAAGSVTIKATDGTSETFVVTGSTKVRVNGSTGTISQVKAGDRVAVVGTGSGPMTATRLVDRGAPGTQHTTKHTGTKHTGTTATPTPTTTAPTS